MRLSDKIGLVLGIVLILIGSIFQVYFQVNIDNRAYYAEKISDRINSEINHTLYFHRDLNNKYQDFELLRFSELLDPSVNPYFIFRDSRLVFWSTQEEIPPDNPKREGVFLVNRQDEILLVVSSFIDNSDYNICTVIPIVKTPSVQNQYLKNSFNEVIFSNKDFRVSFPKVLSTTVQYNDGNLLSFSLGDQYSNRSHWTNYVSVISLLIAATIFLTLTFSFSTRALSKKKIFQGLSIFLIPWILVFVSMKLIVNEIIWYNELSDPIIFSFNEIFLNTLIELLFWSLFILSAALLISRNSYLLFRVFKRKKQKERVLTQVSAIVLTYFITLSLVWLIRLLYHHSLISLDINHSLSFGWSRWASVAVLVVYGNAVFIITNFLKEIILYTKGSSKSFWLTLFGTQAALLVLIFFIDVAWIGSIAILLFYVISYILTNKITFEIPHYEVLIYFLFVVFLIAGIYSIAIQKYELERSIDKLESFANQSLIEVDAFGEYLLDEANIKIKEDPFISNWMSSPFISKELISNKIRQVYLGRYFDKYDVSILLFNQAGVPFDVNAGFSNYHVIKERFAVEENATDYDNVYEIGRVNISLLKRYISFIEVKRYGITTGYIILDVDQKILAPRSVYPELLVDSRVFVDSNLDDLSYAVYSDGNLLYDAGNFNYTSRIGYYSLKSVQEESSWIISGGFLHLSIPLDGSRLLIVSSREHTYYELVSNFSFLFFVVTILAGVYVFIRFIFRRFWLKDISYSTRIQIYFNVAFFIPLLLVSITTISTLNNKTIQNLKEEYRDKSAVIAEEIQQDLDRYLLNMTSRENLREKLSAVARFQNVDVNLYSTSGRLIVTTQPEIYNKNLINMYCNPNAVIEIVEQNNRSVFMNETLGNLGFNSTYTEIRTSDTARMIGIIGLPNFNFNAILEEQQVGIITNTLIIFTLIFLTLAGVSYVFSKKLTQPLKTVAEKLKRTSLTDYNEPLEWQAKDEIGLLIQEYNRMVMNLEKSKEALERNQKELAWRNIARQVAHEIKNPLTPMKLTLQMMQKQLIENGEKEFDQSKFSKSVGTLLHQIEILSDIASSFSAFAKMPMPETKRFEVTESVVKAFNLYKDTDNAEFELNIQKRPIYVMGDQKMMGRILTNIILNAIQASEERKVKIQGNVSLNTNGNVIISIEDNGPGIPEEIREKIFMPYFSTKPEGTGIGLAMAKHGIDQSGGQIWFDSNEKGTKFFIEIPSEE